MKASAPITQAITRPTSPDFLVVEEVVLALDREALLDLVDLVVLVDFGVGLVAGLRAGTVLVLPALVVTVLVAFGCALVAGFLVATIILLLYLIIYIIQRKSDFV